MLFQAHEKASLASTTFDFTELGIPFFGNTSFLYRGCIDADLDD